MGSDLIGDVWTKYLQGVRMTECEYSKLDPIYGQKMRLLHGAIGIATEAGEILDQMKKNIYYEKPVDTVNLIEELGDLLYYIAVMADTIPVSLNQILDANAQKLKKRYPKGFDKKDALHRDITHELNHIQEKELDLYKLDEPEYF